MRQFAIGLFILGNCCLHLSAQTFKVDTLTYNGSPSKRINIVFLSDGYQQNELDKFVADARNIVAQLLSQEPFSEYARYFNVFAIRVPSNVSGAALDPNNPIDNYFGSAFNVSGIARLLVPLKTTRIYDVLAANFPHYDLVCMVVNSTTYGGSGGFAATASINSASAEIAIHEIGHSFAGLRDEYWAGISYASEGPNMTKTSDKETIKWKNWLGKEGVGIYPFAEDNSWFRPHQNCRMRVLGVPFCAVCREAFIETFFQKSSPVDSYTPLSGTATQPQDFTLKLNRPLPNTLHVQWKLNAVDVAKDTSMMKLNGQQSQNGVLLVRVTDTTVLYKKNKIYEHFVKWTISNSTIVSKDSVAVHDTDLTPTITAVDDVFNRSFDLQVYPNPTKDRATLVKGEPDDNVRITVFDSQGKSLHVPEELTSDGFHSLDLTRQPSGIYFIILESAFGTFRAKLLKQ